MKEFVQIVVTAIKGLAVGYFIICKLLKQTVIFEESPYFAMPDLRKMTCKDLKADDFSIPLNPLNLRSVSSARSINLSASLPSKVGIAFISKAIIYFYRKDT